MMRLVSFAGSHRRRHCKCPLISRPARCCWRSRAAATERPEKSGPGSKRNQRMSKITIVDLEVFYCVGVTDEERATPQRLLLTVDMNFDFSSAAVSDRIEKTINYHSVIQELLKFGEGRNWKL